MRLVLLRHGESEWNRLNLFTGWHDIGLSEKGMLEAEEGGTLLRKEGFDFDVCYTSYLKRAIDTLNIVLKEMDREWLPVIKDWRLNERHYGALQGLNKAETAEKFGEDQVRIWRRSYDVPPPPLDDDDPRNPALQEQYRYENKNELPLTESLKITTERVLPYYRETIERDMRAGKRVLVSSHGNSIRAIVKHLDNLGEKEIVGVNIPTGVPLVYEFDKDLKVVGKRYLGDADELSKRLASAEAVKK